MASFRNSNTERLFDRQPVRCFPAALRPVMLRKLLLFDEAVALEELRVPPGNRLEKLKGDRAGHSCQPAMAGVLPLERWCGTGLCNHRVPLAAMTMRRASIHRGEILLTEFLEPLALSQYRLAHDLSAPPRCINEIYITLCFPW